MKTLALRAVGLVAGCLGLAPLVLVTSCALFGGSSGEMKVSEVAPLVVDVSTRHDGYVTADITLDPTDSAQFLAESSELRALFPKKPVDPDDPQGESEYVSKYIHVDVLEPAATPVMLRYDAYVNADSTNPALMTLLRSTLILRDLFAAAKE